MEFVTEENRVFAESAKGAVLAEVLFPDLDEHTVEITHTYVDVSLRGQGIAGQLLLATAKQLRAQGKKALPSCSYAVQWFKKHPEYTDLLA